MSKQRINVGTGINTGTGDTLRSAMEKCNNNFDELYDLMGQDSTGKSIDISGNTISSTFTNTDINISPNGSGDTVISSDLVVNKIKSDDSTNIRVADNLVPAADNTYSLGSPDRKWSDIYVEGGSIYIGSLILKDSGSNSLSILRSDGSTQASIEDTSVGITMVGDDSTGTLINTGATMKFAGAQNITTAMSGDVLTITGPNLSSYLTDTTLNVVADDSSTISINNNGTLLFNGEQNITTSTSSSGVVTITGPDLTSYATTSYVDTQDSNIASDTLTFTNKTFDANGTGNSISNLEVADFASAAFRDEDDMSSNSATAVASQQSIKAYVDTETANVASDTLTFTNKTFDANSTGNSLSNVDIADFTAGVFLDEDNMSSNSATAIASQQSIKAYVDAEDANIASDSLTFTNKSGNISQWTNDAGYLTSSSVTLVGDDSSGFTAVSDDTIKFQGFNGITVTTTDDSSGTGQVHRVEITGTTVPTAVSSLSNDSGYITASSTDSLTNKTFDALSTGNSITNIQVADFAVGSIVGDVTDLDSTVYDNVTSLPTTAAVINYVETDGFTQRSNYEKSFLYDTQTLIDILPDGLMSSNHSEGNPWNNYTGLEISATIRKIQADSTRSSGATQHVNFILIWNYPYLLEQGFNVNVYLTPSVISDTHSGTRIISSEFTNPQDDSTGPYYKHIPGPTGGANLYLRHRLLNMDGSTAHDIKIRGTYKFIPTFD